MWSWAADLPDVVQALQQAEQKNALSSQFEIDALPEAGRGYDGNKEKNESVDFAATGGGQPAANPAPMGGKPGRVELKADESDDAEPAGDASETPAKQKRGFIY